ncbi:LysR family transcriptional regulator [Marinomonas mediterranea]|jgi:Transcriptional regulator|uniref:Transcriptional regulator, LysR family n=1 Tax=Marinomonas mediterranea (strain ATCC 700492 / JCM 21426 / NBRC 103028 / MMB-1) TaxID=717774 RepID=F2JU85_MARM1|nr:LysR family transcriptional regulator [Marinomonas mediterranea]ADZ91597.1 transcriptional regulator, LysR family [Marinomonas mediterranea MMB-1]WCN09557.1 LysR family transcriptional regulator [Marinomonas mediterranea]WCN13635.1 LysR family transcriptional regulator [Marinomonas mediterranea]WCN17698.1 LysR family transcriptional regulator [Marinomonas mediterranea MMB-1]
MNTVKLAPLLLIFVEVAKKRSFTAAAKKLGMSKSAISQQIKRLEESIGHQLLIRNTRGVVLTSAGETLLARSELLNEQLSLTLTELNSEKEQPSGHFKVSVPPFFEKGIVIPALKQLCLEFPKLTPEVVVTEKWQDLIEHNLDAAIFGGDIKNCDYRALSVGVVSEVFCASPRYLKQYGDVTSIENLSEHKYIATAWHREKIQIFANDYSNEQRIALPYSAKVNTLTSALEVVLNDMGVALLPEFLAQTHLNQENLVRVLPDLRGRSWHFYFLHQYKGEKPIHVTRFYQLYRHYFNKGIAPFQPST